jgi:SAM-dependent methyltransferase
MKEANSPAQSQAVAPEDVSPPDQRAYWDANLDAGNLGREGTLDFARERRFFLAAPDLRRALERLGDLKGLSIADAGGGLGVASAIFAERGAARVALVDLAPQRVERASRLMAELGFSDRFEAHVAGAEALPFPEGSLDRVFTRSVLIHADLPAALKEIRRVLKPGGRAVFVEPLTGNPLANLYRRWLAPKEWDGLTRYFDDERIALVREAFGGNLRDERFYLLGFGAFAFQFALASPGLFRAALMATQPLDAALLAVGGAAARRRAWFAVLTAEKLTSETSEPV